MGILDFLTAKKNTTRGRDTSTALDSFGAVAQRIQPTADWNTLVLPEQERQTLRQIAADAKALPRRRRRWPFFAGRTGNTGNLVLFAGGSETNNALAAEVLAKELQLSLYRIDLGPVVSKYIGETEKNLDRLFDAAEATDVVLFFDQADALFGKRSEVKDSHDRYANLETDYLLQRLERLPGLVIVAANMRQALDPAFLRRLRFVVNFPFPGPSTR